jgi:putative acetyltransferase
MTPFRPMRRPSVSRWFGLPKLPARYATLVMPLFLSVLMTFIVSLVSTLRTIGPVSGFVGLWMSAWGLSWLVAFPTLLLVLPLVRKATAAVVDLPRAAARIALESPDQPDVVALIAELDAYQDSLYPPESRHALDLASLKQPQVRFVVARDAAGRAIGCGAVVLSPEFGELKRMYVGSASRGQGVASGILALLESQARRSGCTLLKLETGPYQPEALAFYARNGYARRGPFGGYADDPLSVFMQKRLDG